MEDKTMIKMGGLWENKDKNGDIYYSGSLGNGRVMIFKNKYKEKENQPAYNLFIAENKKEDSDSKGFNRDIEEMYQDNKPPF